jgi:CheY-like chemotaxis protein
MVSIRVLHVDDEPDIGEVVAMSLGLDPELETRSCSSGLEAIAAAAEWLPDIILLDVMMPGMDGPATLARLRADPVTTGIPVIFMTARAQARELEVFRSIGAAGIIAKPFDPMTLAAQVRANVQPAAAAPAPQPFVFPQGIRTDFIKRLRDDTTKLGAYRAALLLDHSSMVARTAILDIAHRLAGASALFGFPAISEAAIALEESVTAQGGVAGSVTDITAALDGLLACPVSDETATAQPAAAPLHA